MLQIQRRPDLEDIKPFYSFESITIESDADVPLAADAIKQVHDRIKAIKAWHQDVVSPIKKGIAAFEDGIRPARQALENIEATIKGKLESFWDRQRKAIALEAAKQRDAEIAAAKQLASENLEVAITTGSETAKESAVRFDNHAERLETKPLDVSQTVRTGSTTIAQRMVWEWAITNSADIPRQFLVVDEKAINAIAKIYDKTPTIIPGIEFKQVSRAAVVR